MVNSFVSAILSKTINCVGEPLDHHLKVCSCLILYHYITNNKKYIFAAPGFRY